MTERAASQVVAQQSEPQAVVKSVEQVVHLAVSEQAESEVVTERTDPKAVAD